jgi:alcohol dehydrogenase (NADP+)
MENDEIKAYIKLNNGYEMPLLGLGTYRLENINETVKSAIKIGYKLFDTAKLYLNEEEIGKALNECISEGLIKREELFVTTKLWQDDHEDPVGALKESLTRLQLDYVDLFLIHWPLPHIKEGKILKKVPLHNLWAGMEDCVNQGLTRSIGVCNFNVQLLLDLLSYCNIKPVNNQVELHPLLAQFDLVDFCHKNEISITAYNPILRGGYAVRNKQLFEKYDLFKNSLILEFSKKYQKTPAQVILNWHANRNISTIPKSGNPERQEENLKSIEFKMSGEDYEKINNLDLNLRFNISKEKEFSGGVNVFA